MTQNPQITRLLRFVTWIESGVVFISGVGLFFFPDWMGTLWPWLIAPFNMRFMGAIYLTSWVAAGLLTWHGRWSPGPDS